MVEENKPGLEDWFQKILAVHGRPCYLLIKIGEKGYSLVAGANSLDGMSTVLDEKSKDNYQYIG